MHAENPTKPSIAVSLQERETGRRKFTIQFFLLYCLILIVALGVYYNVLSSGYIKLPINDLLTLLRDYCPMQGDKEGDLGLCPRQSTLAMPPVTFGMCVWVDEPSVLPMVHSTLKHVDQRLAETPLQPGELNKTVEKKRYIYPFVHVQKEVQEKIMLTHANTSDACIFPTQSDAIRILGQHARLQQMGLRTFKHVFNPDLSNEMQMIGLSIFNLPAKLFGFIQDSRANPIWCHTFDVLQSFCVVLVDPECQDRANNSPCSDDIEHRFALMGKHITAGIASVLAVGLSIDSFRPNDVRVWHQLRDQAGCAYAMCSLRALRDTLMNRLDMHTHHKLQVLFTRTQKLVEQREFVLAARAADDLQFHPLHAPVLFMPLDSKLTFHIVIIAPFLLMTFMSAHFAFVNFRLKRRCPKGV